MRRVSTSTGRNGGSLADVGMGVSLNCDIVARSPFSEYWDEDCGENEDEEGYTAYDSSDDCFFGVRCRV